MSNEDQQNLEPAFVHVPLDTLTIFHITEAELDALERGSPESIFLNLAVCVVSIAISFTIALLTTKIDSVYTFCFFLIVTFGSYISAVTFGLLCWQSRRPLKSVAHEIRRRRPPKGIQVDR